MEDKTHSELLIELALSHLQKGTLDKHLLRKLCYEIKIATIEEFSEALNEHNKTF